MSRPSLHATVFVLLLSLGAGISARQAGRVSPQTASRLESALDAIAQDAIKSRGIPGLSVAIGRQGKLVLAKGYGLANIELDVPVRPDSVFRIGSITKQFTAAAVMKLIENGVLSLDDRVEKFVPDFPVGDRVITVRHLLNHTSGIKSYTGLGPKFWSVSRQDLSHTELLDLVKAEPPDFAPGEKWLYNNSGYYLLGMIIEKASGSKYSDYVTANVLNPVGLTATVYCDLEPIIPRRVSGYSTSPQATVRNADPLSMKPPFAAGALCSTATDLVTWTFALAGGKVVKPASYTLMTTKTKLNDGTEHPYGFGLALGELAGHRRVGHGGGINGFLSNLAYYPDDGVVVALLVNTGSTKLDPVIEAIARAALELPASTTAQQTPVR